MLTIGALLVGLVGGLAVGWVGGFGLQPFRSEGGVAGDGSSGSSSGEEQLYTCGMHPNVIQKGPGECPICHMKLTPMKSGDGGGAQSKERRILYWRAPMDPNYVSDSPGKSPMGMDLVPVYADEAESASAHDIRIDPVTIQNMGIRTATVRRGPLIKTTRTVGLVDYDEQRVTFVDTKFSGWIEKLSVDQTGQRVERGDLLFSVYSPELYAAQQELLSAVMSEPRLRESTFAPAREEAVKLIDAAETKLRYFDVSDKQIESLRSSKKIEKSLAIHSPAGGIVTEKMALEGMRVEPGMRLYTIADLSRVWVYVDIYEYQLPWIRVGQTATMTLPYVSGESFTGRVVYIYPYLEQHTRVIKVRLEFANPDMRLKPGMFANVRLESELQRDAVLIPREAYIDSGTRQIAFIDRGDGKFAPRDIQVGVEAENGMVEVLYGIDEGEVVVTSGQFMLDAESKLKEAVAKMLEAERADTTKRAPQPAHESLEHDYTMPESAAYTCPMEFHPDEENPEHQGPYFSAEAGQCPWCGMKLKPIEEFAWTAKYREGGDPVGETGSSSIAGIPQGANYACPMDTHPDESDPAKQGAYYSEKPGSCPWCGMRLKPLDELDWVRLRRAAAGAEVAYTCVDHPHVFSDKPGECPRCGKPLEPFKVMWSCPDPAHAGEVSARAGNCPRCERGLAAFRGVWLDPDMAGKNFPPRTTPPEAAPYLCDVHPLVHSDEPGRCTICAEPLVSSDPETPAVALKALPAAATHTCPMQECGHFAEAAGTCPVCGMRLKPIEEVPWAAAMPDASGGGENAYLCPMHPDTQRARKPGTCAICGMQLVAEAKYQQPHDAPSRIAAQVNYITEHYLELQRLLAADKTGDVARQALGIAAASETLMDQLEDPAAKSSDEIKSAARRVHSAALKMTGANLENDRVTFVELSDATRVLIEHARPDRRRWPKLYIFHCPMSKGDWIQTGAQKANPYYGFKMLDCGELQSVE